MDQLSRKAAIDCMVPVPKTCLLYTSSRMGNQTQEFKGGTFKSAVKAKCPIVPCALIDSFIPFDENSIRPVTVKIYYLKDVYKRQFLTRAFGLSSVVVSHILVIGIL